MSSQHSKDNCQSQSVSGSKSDASKQPTATEKKPYFPGFLDTLFGIPPTASNAKKLETPDTLAPPAVPTDSTKNAVAVESTEPPRVIFSQPDCPLKPHFAHSRAELIFTPPAPKVYITPDAYKRMCLYVELAPQEVGWLGTVSKRPDGNFMIEEVFLVEQEVTAVETELSVDGCAKLVVELLEGGEPGLERANKLQFWGHSHVRMGTTPSGTDERTMQRFAGEGHEFYVRGIFNKLGRGTFDVYYFDKGYRILDVPWAVMDPSTSQTVLEQSNYSRISSGSWRSTWRDLLGNKVDERDAAPSVTASVPLPEVLVIDDALRGEVTADYNAKIKERRPEFLQWFSSLKKDQADLPTEPIGTENASLVSESKPDGLTWEESTADRGIALPNSAKTGGFCSWLASLFQAPPTRQAEPTPRNSDVPRFSGDNANNAGHTRYSATPSTANDTKHATPGSSIQSNPISPLKPDRGDLPS